MEKWQSISRTISPLRRTRGQRRKNHRSLRPNLRLEKLEPRYLMNADNNPDPLAGEDESPTVETELPETDVRIDTPITFPIAPIALPAVPIFSPIDSDTVLPWQPSKSATISLPEEGFNSEQEIRDWLVESIDREFGDLFGTTANRRTWNFYPYFKIDIIGLPGMMLQTNADAAVPRSLQVASASDSFSETNVQVEGVDEADLIETDGRYIYLVTGNELLIIDALDPEELAITSRIQLEETPTGMYLSGDRLTVISEASSSAGYDNPLTFRLLDIDHVREAKPPKTTVTVIDLTDRAAPKQVQRTEMVGQVVSSRMVDGQLRLVVSHSLGYGGLKLPNLQTTSTFNEETNETIHTYESRADYLDRAVDEMMDTLLSTYLTYSADGEVLSEERLVDPSDLWSEETRLGLHRTTIATFDVLANEAGPSDKKTIFTGGATEIYSTKDSLYVFGQSNVSDLHQTGTLTWIWGSSNQTTIWKFDIDAEDHSIERAARGKVNGTLLNQFSVDEHEGYLRLVTSPSQWGSGQELRILEQVGNRLEEVGMVEDIAPGEDLYSVRFMGDRAYAVTFRKVDPLFAIDLSDPANPQVMGELKIPGYSDYLQPIDENHLLAIGRGANEANGRFEELQVSIFDVSDLSDPQLAHRYSFEGERSTATIATGGRWTRGDGDHHAVSYFASEEILAIPIHTESGGWWTRNNEELTPIFEPGEGGLQVFSIDTETGFEPLALIEHDSPIQRSLRIGDSLFAFSSGEISTHDITNPTQELDSLQLLIGAELGLVQLTDYVTISEEQAPRVVAVALSEGKTDPEVIAPISLVFIPPVAEAVANQVPEERTAVDILPSLELNEVVVSPTAGPDTFIASLLDGPDLELASAPRQTFDHSVSAEIVDVSLPVNTTSLAVDSELSDQLFDLLGEEKVREFTDALESEIGEASLFLALESELVFD